MLRIQIISIITLLQLFFFVFPVEANIVGFVVEAKGNVFLFSSQNDLLPVKPGMLVSNEDLFTVQKGAQVTLKFRDGSEVILFEKTAFTIGVNEKWVEGKRSIVKTLLLISGELWANILPESNYILQTPTVAIKGQAITIRLKVDPAQVLDQVSVGEGTVEVITDTTSVRLEKGQQLQFVPKTIILAEKIETQPAKIELISLQKDLYLPRSGKLRVKINATLFGVEPVELQQHPIAGTIKTDSLNILIPQPRFIFNQPTISIEVAAIGSGLSKIYAVLDPRAGTPAIEGQLTIDVKAVKHKKILKIQTVKGVLIIKLAPK